jgi:hypothetical protein
MMTVDETIRAAKAWEMNNMKQNENRKRKLTEYDIVPYYLGGFLLAFIGFGVYLDPILVFSMVLLVSGFILLVTMPNIIAWVINKVQDRGKDTTVHEKTEYMDIFSEPGTRIIYTGKNGWPGETDLANQFLSIGGIYTVEEMQVSSSYSRVKLLEVDAKFFNTVMFRNVD